MAFELSVLVIKGTTILFSARVWPGGSCLLCEHDYKLINLSVNIIVDVHKGLVEKVLMPSLLLIGNGWKHKGRRERSGSTKPRAKKSV